MGRDDGHRGKGSRAVARKEFWLGPRFHQQRCGRSWSVCMPNGLFTPSTRIYAGRLSTGQRYAIGTLVRDHNNTRNPLAIAVSRPGRSQFHTMFIIREDVFPDGPGESVHGAAFSHPYAVEHEDRLYVAYSNDGGRGGIRNSAELAGIPITSLTEVEVPRASSK